VNPSPDVPPATADEPIDEYDLEALTAVADLYGRIDPVPAGLIDRTWFRIEMEGINAEVARILEEDRLDLAAVRGHEVTHGITFQSASLFIKIIITRRSDGTVRLDGWLAPAGTHLVDVRAASGTVQTRADAEGRFAFPRVARGHIRLLVGMEAAGPGEAAKSVETGEFEV
jgi:hypothetical protein